jgi:hypothetical protein
MSKSRPEIHLASKLRPTSRSSGLLLFDTANGMADLTPFRLEKVPSTTPRFEARDTSHCWPIDVHATEIDEEAIDGADEGRAASPAPEIVEEDQVTIAVTQQRDMPALGVDLSTVEDVISCSSPSEKNLDNSNSEIVPDSESENESPKMKSDKTSQHPAGRPAAFSPTTYHDDAQQYQSPSAEVDGHSGPIQSRSDPSTSPACVMAEAEHKTPAGARPLPSVDRVDATDGDGGAMPQDDDAVRRHSSVSPPPASAKARQRRRRQPPSRVDASPSPSGGSDAAQARDSASESVRPLQLPRRSAQRS